VGGETKGRERGRGGERGTEDMWEGRRKEGREEEEGKGERRICGRGDERKGERKRRGKGEGGYVGGRTKEGRETGRAHLFAVNGLVPEVVVTF
jgi:hypothetical protein